MNTRLINEPSRTYSFRVLPIVIHSHIPALLWSEAFGAIAAAGLGVNGVFSTSHACAAMTNGSLALWMPQ